MDLQNKNKQKKHNNCQVKFPSYQIDIKLNIGRHANQLSEKVNKTQFML